MMEALLPSWLSKLPNPVESHRHGVNASSQFLGAFWWHTRYQLLMLHNTAIDGGLSRDCHNMAGNSFGLAQPRYLSSIVLPLPQVQQVNEWTTQLLAIRGIEEVVVMPDQQVAYIKVDKQSL